MTTATGIGSSAEEKASEMQMPVDSSNATTNNVVGLLDDCVDCVDIIFEEQKVRFFFFVLLLLLCRNILLTAESIIQRNL